jgi:hypothetical protein
VRSLRARTHPVVAGGARHVRRPLRSGARPRHSREKERGGEEKKRHVSQSKGVGRPARPCFEYGDKAVVHSTG